MVSYVISIREKMERMVLENVEKAQEAPEEVV